AKASCFREKRRAHLPASRVVTEKSPTAPFAERNRAVSTVPCSMFQPGMTFRRRPAMSRQHCTSRACRLLLVLTLVLGFCLRRGLPVLAAEPSPEKALQQTKQVPLTLDCSGSMAGRKAEAM